VKFYIVRVINFEEDADKILYIGTDISTRLLEVIIVENRDGEEVIIHAQKLTKKFMEIIETKSGKQLKVTRESIRKSVRHAHKLIKQGLPDAEQGPYMIDGVTGYVVKRSSGKIIGKLNKG
jgi:hypothetical protein